MEDLPRPCFDSCDDTFPDLPASVVVSPSLLTLPSGCDPDSTFTATTSTGLAYDRAHPLYRTETSVLFVGQGASGLCAIKCSPFKRRLRGEWEAYQAVGACASIVACHSFWVEGDLAFLELELGCGSIAHAAGALLPHAWALIADIAEALQCLHARGFVHCDISPGNILCFQGPAFKLTDFGTVTRADDPRLDCVGSGPYISPEALSGAAPVSAASDVWGLGAILLEVACGRAMPRASDFGGYRAIRSGDFDLAVVPEEFAIVRAMLHPNPGRRPTAEQILACARAHAGLSAVAERLAAAGKACGPSGENVDARPIM
jgi:hypothetical protein